MGFHPAALAALVACACAQESYVSSPTGGWRSLAVQRDGPRLTLTVEPGGTPWGRVQIVVDRPAWMALDDRTPPMLREATVDGGAVKVGEGLDISAEGAAPRLRIVVSDADNPADPASPAIFLGGQRLAPESVETVAEGLAAVFDLAELPVGGHDGFLEARDLAPTANALRAPLRVTVNGLLRHGDGQTVTFARGGREYVLGGDYRGQAFVRLGDRGVAAYLTTQMGDKFVYARHVTGIEELAGEAGLRLRADVIGIDGQDFGQIAELEFDAATRPDFPGLLLASRARNLGPPTEVYCFWGWLPGDGFVTAAGENEWSLTYRDIGSVGWVFLPPTQPGAPGIGVLSALRFGESRFGTLLLYTDPQRIRVGADEAVTMRLALMQTDAAQAVAEAHATLQAAGWFDAP